MFVFSVGQVNYPKVADNSSFDEDSSDALSPEQPASHESQGSVPSPMDSRICEPLPSTTGTSLAQVRTGGGLLQCPGASQPLLMCGRGSQNVRVLALCGIDDALWLEVPVVVP